VCHWTADVVQMSLPLAAIMVIFAAFDVASYREQLGGVFVLLLTFIFCAIPYTHLLGKAISPDWIPTIVEGSTTRQYGQFT